MSVATDPCLDLSAGSGVGFSRAIDRRFPGLLRFPKPALRRSPIRNNANCFTVSVAILSFTGPEFETRDGKERRQA